MHPSLLLPLLVCALAAAPVHAQFAASGRATLLAGADTNAPRDYDATSAGQDATASLVVDGQAQVARGPLRAFGDLSLGGRGFLRYGAENVFVSAGTAELELQALETLSVSLLGSGKDRRGGQRDYTDGVGQALVTWAPDRRLQVRLRGGLHGFAYRPNPDYGFTAVEWGGTLSWRFDARHRVLGALDTGTRTYPSLARDETGVPPGGAPRRQDGMLSASAAYEYRGPVRVRADYAWTEQRSNSFGETNLRHRLSALVGMRLPWELTAVVTGALQWTRFPDGIFLSSDILLANDEENANSVSLRLARPVSDAVDVELRYALFQYQLPANQLSYQRQVAFAGVSARWGD